MSSGSEQGNTSSTQTATAGASSTAVAIGTTVETPAGESLGTVVDFVADASGTPSYVVISMAGETTAVPYATVSPMVRNGTLVMDRSRLQSAPRVQQGQWRDESSTAWRIESDQYWGSEGRMRSATPGTGTGTSGSGTSSSSSSMEDRG